MSTLSLGQRIRELRMQQGLTQIDLAKGICTPSMVSQIESDRARPSYKVLRMLASRLDVSLDQLLSNVELQLQILSSYKMARSLVAAKEYTAAMPLLLEVIEHSNGQISNSEVQLLIGECYLNTDQLDKAAAMFQQVSERTTFQKDTQLHVSLLENLGLLEMRRKRYQLAIYYLQQALDEIEQMELVDAHMKGRILFQIGFVHSKIGMIQEAIRYYQQAVLLYKGAGTLEEIGKLYLQLAQSYKKANDLGKSVEYSEMALSVYNTIENQTAKLRFEMSCATVYGETGRTDEAIQMLEAVIRKYQELNRLEEMAIACIELSKVRLRTKEYEKATETIVIARALLPELHTYQAWVHRVLGQIEIEREQLQDAVSHLKKAADCFKNVNEIGQWESTMQELSHVYKRLNDPNSALAILEDLATNTRQVMEERGIVL